MKLKRKTGQGLRRQTTEYVQYRINMDDEDRERLNLAIKNHQAVTITVRHRQTKDDISNETLLPLTIYQMRKVRKGAACNNNVKITFSQSQIKHIGKEGGFLPAVPAMIAAAPAVTAVVSSLFNAYSNKKTNDRLIEEKIRHNRAVENKGGSGVYLHKKPTGKGVYLRKKLGGGIYLNKKPGKGINKQRPVAGNGLLHELMKKKKSVL